MRKPEIHEKAESLYGVPLEYWRKFHEMLCQAMGEKGVDAITVAEEMIAIAEANQSPNIADLIFKTGYINELIEKISDHYEIVNIDGLLIKPEIAIPTDESFSDSFHSQVKLMLVVLLKELMESVSQESLKKVIATLEPSEIAEPTALKEFENQASASQSLSQDKMKFSNPAGVFHYLIETLLILSLDREKIIKAIATVGITEAHVAAFFTAELDEIISDIQLNRSAPDLQMLASNLFMAGRIIRFNKNFFTKELIELLMKNYND